MALIATISSSPSATSRTEAVLRDVTGALHRAGHRTAPLVLRDLPAAPLLAADSAQRDIADAVDTVLVADAVVVTTPVYKAAYSGLLKAFLDVLPQFALRDKVVLPLATGGTPAHVLAIDYALRPVLASLAPSAITPGWFVLASQVALAADGSAQIDEGVAAPLREVTTTFLDTLAGRTLHAAEKQFAGQVA